MRTLYKITFFVLFAFSSHIHAAGIEVEAFRIEGLEGFKGKKLSVLYVSARPASLGTPGQIAKVRKILKGPLTFTIDQNGEVSIPAVEVPRDGWSNFNHLIFIVHAQARYSLQNVDGTLPDVLDNENAVPFKTEYSDFLFRKSIEKNRLDLSTGVLRLY